MGSLGRCRAALPQGGALVEPHCGTTHHAYVYHSCAFTITVYPSCIHHAFTTVHLPLLPCLHLLPLCHPCSCRKWLRQCQGISRSPSHVQWQQPGQDHPGQVSATTLAWHAARRQQPQARPACDHLSEWEGADASSGECLQLCGDTIWGLGVGLLPGCRGICCCSGGGWLVPCWRGDPRRKAWIPAWMVQTL